MTDPLLTIGAFARATGLSPTTLRHYDEVGLLPPADVDRATGYRYYTPDLVRRAQLIARMRDVGLPIETMRTVLDGDAAVAGDALLAFAADQSTRTALAQSAVREILGAVTAGRADPPPVQVTVDGPELASALRQVRAAADSDAGSPLSSVLLDVVSGGLDVVATNRHWLAARTIPLTPVQGSGRAVLGLDTVDALADRLERDQDVTLTLGRSTLRAGVDEVAVRDVAYPDHRALLAGLETPRARAVLDRAALVDTVRSAARAQVDLQFTARSLQVCADDLETAVPALVSGEALTVRMGTALLLRALDSAVGPRVVVSAVGVARPVSLRGPYQRGFLALAMPIKPE